MKSAQKRILSLTDDLRDTRSECSNVSDDLASANQEIDTLRKKITQLATRNNLLKSQNATGEESSRESNEAETTLDFSRIGVDEEEANLITENPPKPRRKKVKRKPPKVVEANKDHLNESKTVHQEQEQTNLEEDVQSDTVLDEQDSSVDEEETYEDHVSSQPDTVEQADKAIQVFIETDSEKAGESMDIESLANNITNVSADRFKSTVENNFNNMFQQIGGVVKLAGKLTNERQRTSEAVGDKFIPRTRAPTVMKKTLIAKKSTNPELDEEKSDDQQERSESQRSTSGLDGRISQGRTKAKTLQLNPPPSHTKDVIMNHKMFGVSKKNRTSISIPGFFPDVSQREEMQEVINREESGFFDETESKKQLQGGKLKREVLNKSTDHVLKFLYKMSKNKCSYLERHIGELVRMETLTDEDCIVKQLEVFAQHAIDVLDVISFSVKRISQSGVNFKRNDHEDLTILGTHNVTWDPTKSVAEDESFEVKRMKFLEEMKENQERELDAIAEADQESPPNDQSQGSSMFPDIQERRYSSTMQMQKGIGSFSNDGTKMVRAAAFRNKKLLEKNKRLVDRLRRSGVGMKQIYTILGLAKRANDILSLDDTDDTDMYDNHHENKPSVVQTKKFSMTGQALPQFNAGRRGSLAKNNQRRGSRRGSDALLIQDPTKVYNYVKDGAAESLPPIEPKQGYFGFNTTNITRKRGAEKDTSKQNTWSNRVGPLVQTHAATRALQAQRMRRPSRLAPLVQTQGLAHSQQTQLFGANRIDLSNKTASNQGPSTTVKKTFPALKALPPLAFKNGLRMRPQPRRHRLPSFKSLLD